jgi:hypothetical protein
MLREDLRNIAIRDLLNRDKISVRTCNCCHRAGFESLLDIIEYYESGRSFFDIRGAGKQTCLEMGKLCKNIIPQIEISQNENTLKEKEEQKIAREHEIKELINNKLIFAIENNLITPEEFLNHLSPIQREIFAKKYNELATAYSVRTAHKLAETGFEYFVSRFLFKNHDALLKIHGLGEKSLPEGIDFKGKMKNEISKLIKLSENDLIKEQLIYEKGECIRSDFLFDYYHQNKHLPMFWVIEQQLKSDKSRDIDIFIHSYQIFNDSTILNLKDLGEKHDITRERARQIRDKVFDDVFHTNKLFFSNPEEWDYCKTLFGDKESVWQEDSQVKQLLEQEYCGFSTKFVLHLLSVLFKDTHTLYGGLKGKKRCWNNTVLIKNEFLEIFDFKRFKSEFRKTISKNDTKYILDIDEYVANSKHWIKYDFDKSGHIAGVIRDILRHEFHLFPENIDGNIKIPASKQKNPLDTIYEILKAKGEPMHLNDIFVEFKKNFPGHKYTNPAQLRSYLQRRDDISFRKRNSIYMLHEWKHIKSGTIRDSIIEFLENNDLPQTASSITNYVLQFFPETNVSSVRTSMSNDTRKRFSFFQNNLLGLSNKKYPPQYTQIDRQSEQKKKFAQRLQYLGKFIVENNHFPLFSSKDKTEQSLYRWWESVTNGTAKITEEQQTEIERIKTRYDACLQNGEIREEKFVGEAKITD